MSGGGNIVDNFSANNTSKNNCFVVRLRSGSTWVNTLAMGKDVNIPVDVAHLEFGRDIPHNTLPPSKAVYIWLRIA